MINGRKNTMQAVDMMYCWIVALCSSSEQLKSNKRLCNRLLYFMLDRHYCRCYTGKIVIVYLP